MIVRAVQSGRGMSRWVRIPFPRRWGTGRKKHALFETGRGGEAERPNPLPPSPRGKGEEWVIGRARFLPRYPGDVCRLAARLALPRRPTGGAGWSST